MTWGFLLVTNCCSPASLTLQHTPDSCSTHLGFLFSCANRPHSSVSLIFTVHPGAELQPQTPAETQNFCLFLFFCLFSAPQIHRMTTRDCFEVSICTPPQITTEKQILAEYQNSPDKTKQPLHQHGKKGVGFCCFTENRFSVTFTRMAPLAQARSRRMQTKTCWFFKLTYLSFQTCFLQGCGAKTKLFLGAICQVLHAGTERKDL